MRIRLNRTSALAAATLVASMIAVPLAAGPAQAVAPVERVWTIASSDGGSYGLSYFDLPATTPTVVNPADTADLDSVSASADGTRLVYSRRTATRQQIVVRDMSTRVVRVVEDLPDDDTTYIGGAQLSPNGNTVAWTQFTFTDTGYSIKTRRASVAGGSPVTLVNGYGALAFASNSTLLVQTLGGYNRSMPVAGGTITPMTGLPRFAQQVTVSADGTKIAWSEDTTPDTSDISTAKVTSGTLGSSSGAYSVTGTHLLSTSLDNEEPAFSRDGGTVYWVQYDSCAPVPGDPTACDIGDGQVLSRPFDASSGQSPVPTTAADVVDVAVTSVPGNDTVKPGAATTLPAILNGTAATVRWTLPASTPDLSGTVITRKLGSTVQKRVFVPARRTSYTDSGLTIGSTYTYTFSVVDRANNYATTAPTRNLTAVKAVTPRFANPTSTTSAKAPFPVAIGGTGPTSATWVVNYRAPGSTTWKPWITAAHSGASRVFGSAASTGQLATTSTPGATYRFGTRIADAYGNSTGWYISGQAVVPFDQTKATLYGGGNVYTSSAYLGSYRKLWHTTDYARVTLTGNKLQVVGWRCTTCGVFQIYDGSTLIYTVDTYASSTKARQVLFTRYYSSVGTHTFTIRVKATPGRPDVKLDGFAMRR